MEPMVLSITPAFGEGTTVRLGIEEGRWVSDSGVGGRHLDLGRLFALPGLADCHAHLAADSLSDVDAGGQMPAIRRRAAAQLNAGVFLVIDKGWRDETVLRLLADPPAGRPHLQGAGRIITGDQGYFPGFAVETDGAGLADAVARSNPAGGWVKLIGDWPHKGRGPVVNFSEESLAAACAVAHAAGVRVAIHTMAPDTPGMAVRAGVDSIEHGLYLTEEDIGLLGARGGAWVPTIANTEDVIRSLGAGSSGARVLGTGLARVEETIAMAADAGVAVLAGTDLGLAHGEVAREAVRLHRYGLSTNWAVEAVGPSAYRYLDIPVLTPGASADVLFFDHDPRLDVTVLLRPVAGVRAGRVVFDRPGLFA